MTDGTQFDPIATIKKLRNDIAAIEAIVLALPSPFSGVKGAGRAAMFRETAIVQFALGRQWLGKALGTYGDPTPYPHSDDPTSPIIEPPAYLKLTHDAIAADEVVSNLKLARGLAAEIVERLTLPWPIRETSGSFHRYVSLSRTAMETARMMLGEELGIIREYRQQAEAARSGSDAARKETAHA